MKNILLSSIAYLLAVGFCQSVVVAQTEGRILNGHSAEIGKWPWAVSISRTRLGVPSGHFCGGALVNENYIITAAHCVADTLRTPHRLTAVIGRTQLTSSDGITAAIDGVIVYPGFNAQRFENDFALLRLKNPVPSTSLPIVSGDEAPYWAPGNNAAVIGWGMLDNYYPVRPDHLQEAHIPIISEQECSNRLGLDFSPASMICAGILATSPIANDGVDACQGDSGGPLMVNTPQGWRLVGLVSWGFECGSDRFWGVYSRADVVRDWVNSNPAVPPYIKKNPKILGTARVGSTLTCKAGRWGGDRARFKYRWIDGKGNVLNGGTHAHYRVKSNNVGEVLKCQVTAQNSGGMVKVNSKRFGPIAR